MKIIVGLGNPDDKYKNTFHNLGFMVADKLANSLGLEFSKKKFNALVAETIIKGEKVLIVKPLTYMNLSGESVREFVNFYKIDTKDLLVVYDDFDLSKGSVRIREKGSAGTHNGMRNIIKEIQNENFPRIRLGFKPEKMVMPLIDLVLSGIREEDRELFSCAIETASNAAKDFASGINIDAVMQKHNKTFAKSL